MEISRRAASRRSGSGPRAAGRGLSPVGLALLGTAFLGAAISLYGPALHGPFVSDDLHYVRHNPYVHELGLAPLLVILDPTGPATASVVNYTPLHLLLHALAWKLFGDDVLGHHVLNVALHALASTLLVLLLLRENLPRQAALFGGAFFLLHPANVEAVAWISQLKSSSSLALALAALLALPRRPGLATGLFVAALLAKPTAAFALPVAFWLARSRGDPVPRGGLWLSLASALLAVYALAEFAAHQRSGAAPALLHETPLLLARTVAALFSRYLAMAATGAGVSAFHEPEPAHSPLDPWWLAGLAAAAGLAWRGVALWRRRDPELAWWGWAAVSFAPVSQLFPFLYPMADRYLYFILPGLIGGALLLGEAIRRARVPEPRWRRLRWVPLGLAAALLASFALATHQRAGLWRSSARLLADSAAHYPTGVSASLLAAKRAAQAGDALSAVASLRAAVARGYNRFEQLDADPGLAPVRAHPRFRALVREIAGERIASLSRKGELTQDELRTLAIAHVARGEYPAAAAALERALRVGGPRDDETRADLARLRPLVPDPLR